MSKKKIKNTRQQPHEKLTRLQTELKRLYDENTKLKNVNMLLKAFTKPTASQKIQVLEEYYDWLEEKDYDANQADTYFAYKKKLKKQITQLD